MLVSLNMVVKISMPQTLQFVNEATYSRSVIFFYSVENHDFILLLAEGKRLSIIALFINIASWVSE